MSLLSGVSYTPNPVIKPFLAWSQLGLQFLKFPVVGNSGSWNPKHLEDNTLGQSITPQYVGKETFIKGVESQLCPATHKHRIGVQEWGVTPPPVSFLSPSSAPLECNIQFEAAAGLGPHQPLGFPPSVIILWTLVVYGDLFLKFDFILGLILI